MLILTRKPGEVIYIGDHIKVTVVEIKGNQIRLGIDAPPEFRIFRKEIYDQIQDENRAAADVDTLGSLEGITEALGKKQDGGLGQARSPLSQFTTAKVQSENPEVVKRKKRDRTPDE